MASKRIVRDCPVCGGPMSTTELTCGDCGTAIKSKFAGCSVCRLSDDMYDFLMVFIKARGSIKEMEKELGISYPTVRSRIDDLQRAMGFQTREMAESSRDILDALEKGEISAEEAEARLKGP